LETEGMSEVIRMDSDEKPFLLVGNGPYANRGCEAIAKSSIRLIREFYPDAPIINGSELGSYDQVDETEPFVFHEKCSTVSGGITRMWLSHQIYQRTKILVDLSTAGRFVRDKAPRSRAVLSVGGDLIGLSHGSQILLQYLFFGLAAQKAGKPFVIWGATIGNLDKGGKLKHVAFDHFKKCSLILARDEDTIGYLAANGVADNVRLVADPAFLLEPAQPRIPLPNREPLEESIGFNLSSAYGVQGELGNYRDMIKLGADCVERMMQTSGRPIILVPHIVAFPENMPTNDTIFLSLVKERLAARGLDVPLLPSSLRSWELKWVLGRLYAYVGSRMHSVVGALGAGTPTVSIGFSEKYPALNALLLGHKRFYLSCRDLTPQSCANKLSELLAEQESVRLHLGKRLPEIREMSHRAGQYLKEVVR
jgi:colanic acid/amylovoran biosynthesis protein